MGQFLLWSLIASVVLTVIVNLIPTLFPKTSAKAGRKLAESFDSEDDRRVRVIFPWKFMLIASVGLTVLLNLGAFLAR